MWVLLALLFCGSTQGGEHVLPCGPQNLTLTGSDQLMMSSWEDAPSCSALKEPLIYKLLVLVADKPVHDDEITVTPEQIGSTHFWNWTSHLPLGCVSHSLKLSSRYKNLTSPWTQEQTLPGEKSSVKPMVYPQDRVFQVGSKVTFCCVLPQGQMFERMYVNGQNSTNMEAVQISDQTFVLTVHLDQPSVHSSTDIICKARYQDNVRVNGASAFVGYPPDDKNLQCVTRDLESVECSWTVGRNTNLLRNPTAYQLLGRNCAAASASSGRCSQKVHVDAGERIWTLTAQNPLGTVELWDRADLTHRVHMFPPETVTASSVTARNVNLDWSWTVEQYRHLNVTCQVNISHEGASVVSEDCGVGLNSTVVTELIPNWTYVVTVRCRTHFWNWSEWSSESIFHTEADVPDALDVWMQMKKNHIIVIWKEPLDHQSHGRIIDYTVTRNKKTATEQHSTTTVSPDKHSVVLSVDTSVHYIITVTARNQKGNSKPSTIISPNINTDLARVNTSHIVGVNGSFRLSWASSAAASCGYIVDWYPTSGQRTVEWLKVSPHETNATIVSKNFKDGLRYSLSISACTHDAPLLLERLEGYVREQRIPNGLFKGLKWKQQGSNVDLTWDPISLTEQPAFIKGYVLYWSDDVSNVLNVSTDNPEATILTATKLKLTSYTFTMKARTAVGECGTTSFTVILNSPTDNWVKPVIISLVSVFLLLLLITVLCCRHWTSIKTKVYPPIPKPSLMDMWMPSQDEKHHPLNMDHCYQDEVVDIPQLLCQSQPPVIEHDTHNVKSFVFSQTPKGYYNQPLKNRLSSPIIIPAESALPSSLFRGVFSNPSYNPTRASDDQQPEFKPELHEWTCLQNDCDGYQPQNESVTVTPTDEDTDSHMSCVLTYVLLSQAPPM